MMANPASVSQIRDLDGDNLPYWVVHIGCCFHSPLSCRVVVKRNASKIFLQWITKIGQRKSIRLDRDWKEKKNSRTAEQSTEFGKRMWEDLALAFFICAMPSQVQFVITYVVFSLNFCFSSSSLSLSFSLALALSCSSIDSPSKDFDLADAGQIVS